MFAIWNTIHFSQFFYQEFKSKCFIYVLQFSKKIISLLARIVLQEMTEYFLPQQDISSLMLINFTIFLNGRYL